MLAWPIKVSPWKHFACVCQLVTWKAKVRPSTMLMPEPKLMSSVVRIPTACPGWGFALRGESAKSTSWTWSPSRSDDSCFLGWFFFPSFASVRASAPLWFSDMTRNRPARSGTGLHEVAQTTRRSWKPAAGFPVHEEGDVRVLHQLFALCLHSNERVSILSGPQRKIQTTACCWLEANEKTVSLPTLGFAFIFRLCYVFPSSDTGSDQGGQEEEDLSGVPQNSSQGQKSHQTCFFAACATESVCVVFYGCCLKFKLFDMWSIFFVPPGSLATTLAHGTPLFGFLYILG